jgi:hypothetical protein
VRHQRALPPLRIDYESHSIVSPVTDAEIDEDAANTLEAYGIVGESCPSLSRASTWTHLAIGLLSVSASSFLIVITQRHQVAQIKGKAVYTIKDVAIIPLASQAEATQAISQAQERVKKQAAATGGQPSDESDTSDYEEDNVLSDDEVYNSDDPSARRSSRSRDPSPVPRSRTRVHTRKTSVAEDVIGRKGLYGRFADRWFSQRGWSVEQRRTQGMTAEVGTTDTHSNVQPAVEDPQRIPKVSISESEPRNPTDTGPAPSSPTRLKADNVNSVASSLLPKLLRTTRILFGSSNFFFSYECDITRSPAALEQPPLSTPLHQSVDPLVSDRVDIRRDRDIDESDRCDSTSGTGIFSFPS